MLKVTQKPFHIFESRQQHLIILLGVMMLIGGIMESINNLKGQRTLVIIAHRLASIENCDAVYRVEGGKIVRER